MDTLPVDCYVFFSSLLLLFSFSSPFLFLFLSLFLYGSRLTRCVSTISLRSNSVRATVNVLVWLDCMVTNNTHTHSSSVICSWASAHCKILITVNSRAHSAYAIARLCGLLSCVLFLSFLMYVKSSSTQCMFGEFGPGNSELTLLDTLNRQIQMSQLFGWWSKMYEWPLFRRNKQFCSPFQMKTYQNDWQNPKLLLENGVVEYARCVVLFNVQFRMNAHH